MTTSATTEEITIHTIPLKVAFRYTPGEPGNRHEPEVDPEYELLGARILNGKWAGVDLEIINNFLLYFFEDEIIDALEDKRTK